MGDGSERRQHVRLENSVPVMYWLTPNTAAPVDAMRRSLTKNISGGGVCLYVDAPVPNGTLMDVQMRLPDSDRSFSFTAEVVWCDPAPRTPAVGQSVMAGLRFVKIDPNDQNAIIHYCLRRVPPSA